MKRTQNLLAVAVLAAVAAVASGPYNPPRVPRNTVRPVEKKPKPPASKPDPTGKIAPEMPKVVYTADVVPSGDKPSAQKEAQPKAKK
jgi:hypothetical protein